MMEGLRRDQIFQEFQVLYLFYQLQKILQHYLLISCQNRISCAYFIEIGKLIMSNKIDNLCGQTFGEKLVFKIICSGRLHLVLFHLIKYQLMYFSICHFSGYLLSTGQVFIKQKPLCVCEREIEREGRGR